MYASPLDEGVSLGRSQELAPTRETPCQYDFMAVFAPSDVPCHLPEKCDLAWGVGTSSAGGQRVFWSFASWPDEEDWCTMPFGLRNGTMPPGLGCWQTEGLLVIASWPDEED